MKLKDVLAPVAEEARAVVALFPRGTAAMKEGPLSNDKLAEYNQNYRILYIVGQISDSAQEAIEIPDEGIARVRNNIRRFAFNGTNLIANPDFDQWLASLLKK